MTMPGFMRGMVDDVLGLLEREPKWETGTVSAVSGSLTTTSGLQVTVDTDQGEIDATSAFNVAVGAVVEVRIGGGRRKRFAQVTGFAA